MRKGTYATRRSPLRDTKPLSRQSVEELHMQTSSEAKRRSSLTLKETIQDAPTLAQSCHLVSSCAGTHQFCSGPPIPQNPGGPLQIQVDKSASMLYFIPKLQSNHSGIKKAPFCRRSIAGTAFCNPPAQARPGRFIPRAFESLRRVRGRPRLSPGRPGKLDASGTSTGQILDMPRSHRVHFSVQYRWRGGRAGRRRSTRNRVGK